MRIRSLALLAALASGQFAPVLATPSQPQVDESLEVVAELEQGPGNITVKPQGAINVGPHQFFGSDVRVARGYADGSLRPFAEAAGLSSVLGLPADSNGVVWLLDNAMRGGAKRRLVGWHDADDRLVADIDLDAALLVVDLAAGETRRVLQGHAGVKPEGSTW